MTRRIGIAHLSAGNEPGWSGIPEGIARGIAAGGGEGLLVNVELPRAVAGIVRRWGGLVYGSRLAGALSPEAAAARQLVERLRRPSRPSVEAWIVCGRAIGEGVPLGSREALLADMTVPQALAVGGTGFSQLPPRIVEGIARRQRRRFTSARACCLASDWAAASVVADYGVDPERAHVVGFGRNLDPRPIERDWTTPRYLFVGLDWQRKNGDAVVRAFRRVREHLGRGTLDVVGGHPLLDESGIVPHGPIPLSDSRGRARLESLFENATCFVMPSRFEAFGIVYVEAGAAGVPSIGTTRGGAATAIGRGGVLVDPDDEDDLVRAMVALAEPERSRSVGREARENARRFTWEAVAARTLAAVAHRTDDA